MLPTAVLVRSYQGALEWRRTLELEPVIAPDGGRATYAGAEWRLSGLYKLAAPGEPAATVLAEIEATVVDPAVFAAGGPCEVALTDSEGHRWKSLFLTPRAIREARPQVSDMPSCGAALSGAPKQGDRIVIAETFTIPAEPRSLDVVITVAGQRPAYLRLE
ncbi:MAG TPA: hypothetical protein VNS34_29135 [Rhizobiaceae bacterium]|nr:hypothetical protein [Rhizobiaceae bacterium]